MSLTDLHVRRLAPGDAAVACELFQLMARVFGEPSEPLGEDDAAGLLSRPDFWAVVAEHRGELVGGLTAHTLPLTRAATSEVFLYDIAVLEAHQRKGVGKALVAYLRDAAAAMGSRTVFVAADNADTHALDFYRALGGEGAGVTIFTFQSS